MARITKKEILGRLDYLNKLAGTNYVASYVSHYGGWEMYEIVGDSGHSYSGLGFYYRKTSAEFMAYMAGVIHTIEAIKYGRIKV